MGQAGKMQCGHERQPDTAGALPAQHAQPLRQLSPCLAPEALPPPEDCMAAKAISTACWLLSTSNRPSLQEGQRETKRTRVRHAAQAS